VSKKKDENYYKKLYKKSQKTSVIVFNDMANDIAWNRNILIILCKRDKKRTVIVAKKETEALESEEKLTRRLDKLKNIVFEIEVVKKEEKKDANEKIQDK